MLGPAGAAAGGERLPGGPAPRRVAPAAALRRLRGFGSVENGIIQEQMCTKGVKWETPRRARPRSPPMPAAGPPAATRPRRLIEIELILCELHL